MSNCPKESCNPQDCSGEANKHAGTLIEGSPNVFANSLEVGRVGDQINGVCDSVADEGSCDVFANGIPVVRYLDCSTAHGCYPRRPNNMASPNVFVNGKGVHRKTDTWYEHCCPEESSSSSSSSSELIGNSSSSSDLFSLSSQSSVSDESSSSSSSSSHTCCKCGTCCFSDKSTVSYTNTLSYSGNDQLIISAVAAFNAMDKTQIAFSTCNGPTATWNKVSDPFTVDGFEWVVDITASRNCGNATWGIAVLLYPPAMSLWTEYEYATDTCCYFSAPNTGWSDFTNVTAGSGSGEVQNNKCCYDSAAATCSQTPSDNCPSDSPCNPLP